MTRADVERAAERIAGRVRRTPVMHLEGGAFDVEGKLILKLELLQRTGSFKLRGAFNRLLSADVPPAGVVAASGGNFGLAVAHAARETGHPAEIFVPETSPAVKAQRIRDQGSSVHLIPGYFAEALEACREQAEETGAVLLHAYDEPEVVAGQGTIGMELSDQVTDADTVLVAVGGGGLIGGIAPRKSTDRASRLIRRGGNRFDSSHQRREVTNFFRFVRLFFFAFPLFPFFPFRQCQKDAWTGSLLLRFFCSFNQFPLNLIHQDRK